MARSHRTLPALLLLLAAGAHQPGDAAEAPVAPMCQPPEALATGVALFCAGMLPTAPFCRTLAQAGAACLCLRVAARRRRPERDRPHRALRQLRPRPRRRRLVVLLLLLRRRVGKLGRPCASLTLADQLVVFCGGEAAPPTAPCCEAVAAAVGLGARDVPCFCRAARASRIGVRGVVGLYNACGGLRPGLAGDLAESCERLPKA